MNNFPCLSWPLLLFALLGISLLFLSSLRLSLRSFEVVSRRCHHVIREAKARMWSYVLCVSHSIWQVWLRTDRYEVSACALPRNIGAGTAWSHREDDRLCLAQRHPSSSSTTSWKPTSPRSTYSLQIKITKQKCQAWCWNTIKSLEGRLLSPKLEEILGTWYLECWTVPFCRTCADSSPAKRAKRYVH